MSKLKYSFMVIVRFVEKFYLCRRIVKKYMAENFAENDRMSDLINDDFRLLQVISRFGLSLGFGERTVREICEAHQVDCDTFLAVINFTHFGDKVSSKWVDRISVKSLTEYLKQAHTYF